MTQQTIRCSTTSSSSRADCTDFPDSLSLSLSRSLSLSLSLYHPSLLSGRPNYVQCLYRANVNSCWLANIGASMCRGSYNNVTCKFVFASPTALFVFRVWFFDYNRNSTQYIPMLKNNLTADTDEGEIFQPDGEPCHRSPATQHSLVHKGVTVM